MYRYLLNFVYSITHFYHTWYKEVFNKIKHFINYTDKLFGLRSHLSWPHGHIAEDMSCSIQPVWCYVFIQ